ncbi:MAG: hypothetical protein EOM22_15515 [Gammaproteobacteria bacterium]|nr:hypothetical protein [Gammaproteobacteria bacterium]
MAEKPSIPDAEPKPATASPVVAPILSLDEFCARLSERVRKIPLISGFAADRRKAGHLRDSEAAYQTAFNAFRNRSA